MAGETYFDTLDDPLQFEVSNTFNGGQVSNSRSILLQPNQYNKGINIDLSLNGEAVTRRGTIGLGAIVGGTPTTEGVQGMFWYSTSTNEYLVAANNKKLYSWNGSVWTNFGAAWTNASSAMNYFAQLSDKLYVCNGTVNLFSWDGTTITDLGNAANNQPPANPGLVCEHTNRLVVVGTGANRNTIYFSQFGDGTVYDKQKWSLTVGDANDAITAIKSWSNFNLLVFKRHSVWVINCDPSLQLQDVDGTVQFFEVKPIHKQLGCVATLSVSQVGNDVFFLSQHGIYSVNRIIASGSETEVGPDISWPVHDLIDRITPSSAGKAAGIGYGRKYFLSVPLDADTVPTTVIAWDDTLKCFCGTWTSWLATCWAYCSPVGGNLLRIGTSFNGGLVREWLDYTLVANETTNTFQDSGTDIAASLTTKGYTFGGIGNKKTGSFFRNDFFNSLADCILTAQYDRQSPVAIASLVGTGGTGITFPLSFPVLFPAIKNDPVSTGTQFMGQFGEQKFTIASSSKKMNLISCASAAWTDTLLTGRYSTPVTT